MGEEIEEFIYIPGYEGMYSVSNLGRVKSLDRLTPQNKHLKESFLYQQIGVGGYYRTSLYKNGKIKFFMIHQLVAMAFLDHVPDGIQNLVVNHKDGNRINNNVNNLEIITQRQNAVHGSLKLKNTSNFTGVSWHKASNQWTAQIRIGDGNKKKYLGIFKCELKAAYTYNMYLKNLLSNQQN